MHWDRFDFAHCLNLSLDNPTLNRPLLSAASYFWSDVLSTFMFSNRSMSPTSIDVFALTDLDVTSSANPSNLQILPHQRILTPHQYDIGG
jgi:formylmethanofuran dehydrogenase subunit E-like metal-binding protein